MMFFATRSAARVFASNKGAKPVDMGTNAAPKRRWAVKIVKG